MTYLSKFRGHNMYFLKFRGQFNTSDKVYREFLKIFLHTIIHKKQKQCNKRKIKVLYEFMVL